MNIEREDFKTFRGYALTAPKKRLTPSMEDYLEMIWRLCQEQRYVRVNDLAQALNVKPPSVTSMLQRLNQKGLTSYKKYGLVFLTPTGERIGRFLLWRHQMLEKFLKAIGVRSNLLENVECIEHNLTSEATRCVSLLVDYIGENPAWFKQFQDYCQARTIE